MKPERTFRDAPPSREAVTISRTCPDRVEVKTLITSGMTAPASVPQVMIVESFHHMEPSPSPGMSRYDTRYVSAIETNEVSQTRVVSGASKFIASASPYLAFAISSFSQYEPTDAMTIMMRIAKIQTRSCTCTTGLATARRMKLMSATPVTP